MKPIILDEVTRKCPWCYAEIKRLSTDFDTVWSRRIYCNKSCASFGSKAERKQQMAAKRRVACGDS